MNDSDVGPAVKPSVVGLTGLKIEPSHAHGSQPRAWTAVLGYSLFGLSFGNIYFSFATMFLH